MAVCAVNKSESDSAPGQRMQRLCVECGWTSFFKRPLLFEVAREEERHAGGG